MQNLKNLLLSVLPDVGLLLALALMISLCG